MNPAAWLLGLLALAAPEAAEEAPSQVRLVSESAGIRPGETAWIGLHLTLAQGWHTYWEFPGDSGTPLTAEWRASPGLTVGAFLWPAPERLVEEGLVVFGYHRDVLLMAPLTAAASLRPGSKVTVSAVVDYLVCSESCLTPQDTVRLVLPVLDEGPAPDPAWAPAFERARRQHPAKLPGWRANAKLQGERVILAVSPEGSQPKVTRAMFFPLDALALDLAVPQLLRKEAGGGLRLELVRPAGAAAPARLRGILVTPDRWDASQDVRAMAIDVPVGK